MFIYFGLKDCEVVGFFSVEVEKGIIYINYENFIVELY